MEKHEVLIVDEDGTYVRELNRQASDNYVFKNYEDWETAASELYDNSNNYDAIIFDAIVKYDADEKNGDIGNLHNVISEYKKLQNGLSGIFIPYVIIATDHKNISKTFKGEPVIDKNDFAKIFEELENSISSKDEYKIKIKYSEAFGAFEKGKGYLSSYDKKNLTEVLIDFENNTWSENSFNPLRKVIEAIYKSIHNYDDNLLPDSCVYENGKVNFEFCARRLSGRENTKINMEKIDPILPKHIGWVIQPITQVCHIASHENKKQNITKYSLGTILFGVIDLLIWYKKFIDDKYNNN